MPRRLEDGLDLSFLPDRMIDERGFQLLAKRGAVAGTRTASPLHQPVQSIETSSMRAGVILDRDMHHGLQMMLVDLDLDLVQQPFLVPKMRLGDELQLAQQRDRLAAGPVRAKVDTDLIDQTHHGPMLFIERLVADREGLAPWKRVDHASASGCRPLGAIGSSLRGFQPAGHQDRVKLSKKTRRLSQDAEIALAGELPRNGSRSRDQVPARRSPRRW